MRFPLAKRESNRSVPPSRDVIHLSWIPSLRNDGCHIDDAPIPGAHHHDIACCAQKCAPVRFVRSTASHLRPSSARTRPSRVMARVVQPEYPASRICDGLTKPGLTCPRRQTSMGTAIASPQRLRFRRPLRQFSGIPGGSRHGARRLAPGLARRTPDSL